MKVTVNELLESTHSKELLKLESLQRQIEQAQDFITQNEDSEDAQMLLEVLAKKSTVTRLEREVSSLSDELAKVKEEAGAFWRACNVWQGAKPKAGRLQNALEALEELKSDDVSGLELFKETLARNLREERAKIAPFEMAQSTAPSQWVKLVG